MSSHFKRAVMKATIDQIVNLAEKEVSGHIDDIAAILRTYTNAELKTYHRRLSQLSECVVKEQKSRK